MRFILIPILLLIFPQAILSQCLTDFTKLVPDKTPTYSESFGMSVSVYNDILAVGAPNSDSLGLPASGIVYLYQRSGASWQFLCVLKPSTSIANGRFGGNVKVSQNYILIGATGVSTFNSGVYVYRKPVEGWQAATETVLLKPAGITSFGSSFDISDDEQSIVVTDTGHLQGIGAFYVFHKQPFEEWSNSIPYQMVINPDQANNVIYFGIGGVQIQGNKIACATVSGFTGGGNGSIYVFNDASGNFNQFQMEAKLTETIGTTGSYGPAFLFTNDGIFKYLAGKLLHYQKPTSGTWQSSGPTCEYSFGLIDNVALDNFFVNYTAASDDALYFSVKLTDGSGRLLKLKKQSTDWCGVLTREILYQEPPPVAGGSTLFVRSLSCYADQEIALSWTSSQESKTAVAVGAFSLQGDGLWAKEVLVKSKTEANNFQLGRSLWVSDKFLLSGATRERTLDRDPRGAVYIYQKQGVNWVKVHKLTEQSVQSSDQNFGSDITGFGDYFAVAAHGYSPDRVLIYQGVNRDFSNPKLIQSLLMPIGGIDSYGNMVMNKNFLIVSALVNVAATPRNILMFFKKGPTNQWQYVYDLTLGPSTVILKRPPSIDVEGDRLVASDGYKNVFIIDYNASIDRWVINQTLTASDPDNDPFFGSITFDGSYFGNSVKLNGDKIFVGAPGKNVNGVNDVGAIYVYARKQNEWTSGTEFAKLLPVVKSPDLYFGFSIDVLENTLITGGPSRAQAGKVYVLQSKDYFWKNAIQLLYLEGDTFAKDYYGYDVALSKDDFFITAPLENNLVGMAAGTVYATRPPPIVKLLPPVCHTKAPFTLFGYPFDGVWSGTGIVDQVTGIFDPSIPSFGVHELTYKTPNCFYEGKLLIDVKPSPIAQPTSEVNNVICEEGKTTVTLSAQKESDASYQWFYQVSNGAGFSSLPESTNSLLVNNSKPGNYRVEVNNGYCSLPIDFTVSIEELNVQINPFDKICDASKQWLDLKANVGGGVWQLNGAPSPLIDQSNQKINVASLNDGDYTIHYRYTSKEQCQYKATRDLIVDKLIAAELTVTGDLCVDEFRTIEARLKKEDQFLWYKISNENADTVLLGDERHTLAVKESGFYGIILTRGSCREVSSPIFVEYKDLDEIYIPNVFTPNGDESNQRFKAVSTYSSVNLLVYNRDGKLMFNGDGVTGWDGGDASSGVYYWSVSAVGCSDQIKTFKGWVQLLR